MRIFFALIALFAAAPAAAAGDVSLASEVLVERVKQEADGRTVTVREKPGVVTPGDKLVFLLSYRNTGDAAAEGFVVTNPIPDAVAFAGADSAGAVFSVDGGKSWGALQALQVARPDGTSRPAAPADVTHVRWSFAEAIPAGKDGQLSFRGVVR